MTPDACPACRENQQHITGDIAWATRTYVAMTQDVDWLGETQQGSSHTGNELIVEMAKFWESRPTFSDEKQKWEINGLYQVSAKILVELFIIIIWSFV